MNQIHFLKLILVFLAPNSRVSLIVLSGSLNPYQLMNLFSLWNSSACYGRQTNNEACFKGVKKNKLRLDGNTFILERFTYKVQ